MEHGAKNGTHILHQPNCIATSNLNFIEETVLPAHWRSFATDKARFKQETDQTKKGFE